MSYLILISLSMFIAGIGFGQWHLKRRLETVIEATTEKEREREACLDKPLAER